MTSSLRNLCNRCATRAADLFLPVLDAAGMTLEHFLSASWNREFTWTAGRLAKNIIQMTDLGMLETTIIVRTLMELVANQAVLNAAPEHAVRFSLEEHISNERILDRMGRHGIGSEEELATLKAELEEVASQLRAGGFDPSELDDRNPNPFGMKARDRFEMAGLLPYYDVLYSISSDYAHMNGRAIHKYLEQSEGGDQRQADLAITTDLLIRSLTMTNGRLELDMGKEIDDLKAEYVALSA